MNYLCRKASLVLALAALLLFAGGAKAQETTASIRGTVADASGAVVPGVEVTVTNVNTGLVRRVISDDSGAYLVPSLPIGEYQIEAELPGFKKFVQKGVILHVNEKLVVNITLEVGEITETVTVTSTPPPVQKDSGEVSGLVSEEFTKELPLNGRNFVQLTALMPGVVTNGSFFGVSALSDPTTPFFGKLSTVSVNGTRQNGSNWLVDGGNNVDPGANWTINNLPSVDAIAEFRILQSNYTAEFGRSGGGQVNVVTKTGGTEYHGTLFEFFRNEVLDARPFFSPEKGPLRFNQFGFNVGGPIIPTERWKNRLNFFVSAEWLRASTSTSLVGNTLTEKMRRGDLSEFATPIIDPDTGQPFPGNVIPPGRIDQNARILANLWPLPNRPGIANNFAIDVKGGRESVQQLYRVDYKAEKINLMLRWMRDGVTISKDNGVFSGSSFPVSGSFVDWPGENLVGQLTYIINPSTLYEFQFSRTYDALNQFGTGIFKRSQVPELKIPEIFPNNVNNPGEPNIPGINISGINPIIGTNGLPFINFSDSFQYSQKLTHTRGKHTFKPGLHVAFSRKNEAESIAGVEEGGFNFDGRFTGNPVADFLLGRAQQYEELSALLRSDLAWIDVEPFYQHHLKLGNLALDFGLRYQLLLAPYETSNFMGNFLPFRFDPNNAPIVNEDGTLVPGTGVPRNGIVKAPFDGRRSIIKNRKTNFAPRFGFSWDPFGDGKTAIRGGYGIFFDRTSTSANTQLTINFSEFVRIENTLLSNPAGGAQAPARPTFAAAYDFEAKVPNYQQWSVGIQREVMPQTVFEIRYAGTKGTHLDRRVNLNQPLPNLRASSDRPAGVPPASRDFLRPFRGFSDIIITENSASSNYHSLQIAFNRRFHNGLAFNTSYTAGKAIDNAPGIFFQTEFQDVRNLRAERGLADFDVPQTFTFSWVWELPFYKDRRDALGQLLGGWQMTGIVTFQSGLAEWVFLNRDVAGTGTTLRPNLVGEANFDPGDRSLDRYFNTAAFVFPAAGTFGDAGRNIVRLPGTNNWDIAFYKNFRTPWFGGNLLGEEANIQFRTEFFNIWNHSQFDEVARTLGNPDFGLVNRSRSPRKIQFALKIMW